LMVASMVSSMVVRLVVLTADYMAATKVVSLGVLMAA
jgi:hypothetical protein